MKTSELQTRERDRDLILLAAKAAGMEVLPHDKPWPKGDTGWFFNQVGDNPPALYDRSSRALTMWAPLTDDGDALRLAVRLELIVGHDAEDKLAYAQVRHPHFSANEFYGGTAMSPEEATRRAIVRAAAAIGE